MVSEQDDREAHMSHAEVRTLLAFLMGYDIENVRRASIHTDGSE